MKKMCFALVAVLVLVCWAGSAMAVRIPGAVYCENCENQTLFIEDCGDYHREYCGNAGCGYEAELKHWVYCEDVTKCQRCGNTTNLSDADIVHNMEYIEVEGKWGAIDHKIIYTFDEYKHRVECFCGEKVWEDTHRSSCYTSNPGSCFDCDVENAIIPEADLQHYVLFLDNVGATHVTYCSRCGYVKSEEPHWAYCDSPTACSQCAAANVSEVRHEPVSSSITCAGKTHSYTCARCEKTFSEDHVYDAAGCCELCGRFPGDADNSSSVTPDDAIAILSDNVSSESNADVNADGQVDELDVLRIMQYLAGWDVTLE